ncbi:MAG: glycoside hydrolase family 25 protein [Clostridiales bacterium]|nr:glycoside hydrolase family 25 protein [Clostridiales bacterium]
MLKNVVMFLKNKKQAVILAALLIVIAVLICVSLFGKGKRESETETEISEATAESCKYDWSRLTDKDGRYYYSDGEVRASLCIDVSEHQGDIDWKKVRDDGVKYAFIRVGYRGYMSGIINLDKKFDANMRGASTAGIKTGVYFFSQAINESEAKEEAEYTLKQAGKYAVELPIVFDMEYVTSGDRIDGLTKEEKTAVASAFCDAVLSGGYQALIYGNSAWLTGDIDVVKASEYGLWLALYTKENTFPYDFSIWQYASNGKVDGIDANVDMNLIFEDY